MKWVFAERKLIPKLSTACKVNWTETELFRLTFAQRISLSLNRKRHFTFWIKFGWVRCLVSAKDWSKKWSHPVSLLDMLVRSIWQQFSLIAWNCFICERSLKLAESLWMTDACQLHNIGNRGLPHSSRPQANWMIYPSWWGLPLSAAMPRQTTQFASKDEISLVQVNIRGRYWNALGGIRQLHSSCWSINGCSIMKLEMRGKA